MRVLDGEQFLVRIFFGDADKWHHQPAARARRPRSTQPACGGRTAPPMLASAPR
jgi:hypothetical protein